MTSPAHVPAPALLLACALLGFPLPAWSAAEDSEKSRQAYALSREVMSPFCPGRTLADCPSPDAAALRQEIRDFVAAGQPREQILARLRSRFGDVVIGVPRGFWGWTLPALALLTGAGLLVLTLRRLSRGEPGPPAPSDPALEQEIDEELSRHGL